MGFSFTFYSAFIATPKRVLFSTVHRRAYPGTIILSSITTLIVRALETLGEKNGTITVID